MLLLDGHGSRWSVPAALRSLMDHGVHPFFLSSTPLSGRNQMIAASTSDSTGWAIEQAAKKDRCDPDRALHESGVLQQDIFARGWKYFITEERKELRELGHNNTTNAHGRTGIEPLDPFSPSWTETIEPLGMRHDDNAPSDPEPARNIWYQVVAINGTT
jgi:hypothetical protein